MQHRKNKLADPQILGEQYRLGNHRATYKQPYGNFLLGIVLSAIFITGCLSCVDLQMAIPNEKLLQMLVQHILDARS